MPRPLPTIDAVTPPIRVTEAGTTQGWLRATQLLALARQRRDARLAAEQVAKDEGSEDGSNIGIGLAADVRLSL